MNMPYKLVYLRKTNYPHAFLNKRRGYCNRLHTSVHPGRTDVQTCGRTCPSARLYVCPSVCPLCYLLLNHWTKFNQIWCVSYSHEWGVQQQSFFWPRPLGPWGGVKRSNIKYQISITKSILKIFIPNFECSHK